ncbi:hypothetical protein BKA56DRAFT_602278 [Ilyonectria sp. MPI-CAGE-AT-0026]|nr:hypothetical protein BKA56DRAFT_602278 [Ilyonectria sp. MPI-CAGE-AT-0026]
MTTSIVRESSEENAVQRWINPVTGKPDLLRFKVENLEERTLAAVELFNEGFYRTVKKATDELKLPYYPFDCRKPTLGLRAGIRSNQRAANERYIQPHLIYTVIEAIPGST